tara:strand:+ start:276 stop:935 length:660 start_codon:yes stop_codon:yes gene_type:complete
MPAYFFQRAISMAQQDFEQELKSMRALYEGDIKPVDRIREIAQEEDSLNPNQLLQGTGKTKRLLSGRLYMFNYRNPIAKNTLPYYDMFPVVLVINHRPSKNYFQGLNFHYLPPKYRAEILDELYRYMINEGAEGDSISRTIRARLSPRVDYEFMKKRRSMMSFKPLWRRYNLDRVIGQYLYVPPKAWDVITMMPLARFRKRGINSIYMDSLTERRERRQ